MLKPRDLDLRPVSQHLLDLTWASRLISLRFNFLLLKVDIMTDPPFLPHSVIVTIKCITELEIKF